MNEEVVPHSGSERSSFENAVIQKGTLFWRFGVNAALELGVVDVCCQFGMVPFAYVPSIAMQSSLQNIVQVTLSVPGVAGGGLGNPGF